MPNSITEEQFVALLLRFGPRLKTFVATLLPLCQDVEEVVQESSLVAWRKIDTFRYSSETPDADFLNWVCTIGRFQALNYRRKHWGREKLFDDEVLDRIAALQLQHADRLELRQEALQECLRRLTTKDKELLRLRYSSDISVETVAKHAGRTVSAIYKSLTRIRKALSTCIEHALHSEEIA